MPDHQGQYPIDLAASQGMNVIRDHLFQLMNNVSYNLALNSESTEQSSTFVSKWTSSKAVNGDTLAETGAADGNLSCTNEELNPWWQVDLGGVCFITSITVYNRLALVSGRAECLNRLRGFQLKIYKNGVVTHTYTNTDTGLMAEMIDIGPTQLDSQYIFGDKVKISIPRNEFLHLREVEVNGIKLSSPTLNNKLSFGANGCDSEGRNRLHYALFSHDKSLITRVFNAYPGDAMTPDHQGQYPIDVAASRQDMNGSGGIYDHLFELMNHTNHNLALSKSTEQSSTVNYHCPSNQAVNGNTQVEIAGVADRYPSSTDREHHPWWQVDLGGVCFITSVKVYNRLVTGVYYSLCLDRLRGFHLEIYKNGVVTHTYINNDDGDMGEIIDITADDHFGSKYIFGDKVKITLPKQEYLHLREVEVNGT
eukprot:763361_1